MERKRTLRKNKRYIRFHYTYLAPHDTFASTGPSSGHGEFEQKVAILGPALVVEP